MSEKAPGSTQGNKSKVDSLKFMMRQDKAADKQT